MINVTMLELEIGVQVINSLLCSIFTNFVTIWIYRGENPHLLQQYNKIAKNIKQFFSYILSQAQQS